MLNAAMVSRESVAFGRIGRGETAGTLGVEVAFGASDRESEGL
jgi:hypothetical protein